MLARGFFLATSLLCLLLHAQVGGGCQPLSPPGGDQRESHLKQLLHTELIQLAEVGLVASYVQWPCAAGLGASSLRGQRELLLQPSGRMAKLPATCPA